MEGCQCNARQVSDGRRQRRGEGCGFRTLGEALVVGLLLQVMGAPLVRGSQYHNPSACCLLAAGTEMMLAMRYTYMPMRAQRSYPGRGGIQYLLYILPCLRFMLGARAGEQGPCAPPPLLTCPPCLLAAGDQRSALKKPVLVYRKGLLAAVASPFVVAAGLRFGLIGRRWGRSPPRRIGLHTWCVWWRCGMGECFS